MDEEDPILLSLADALTCAFGASIALFLIFVVLVRFEPPAPIPTSGTANARSITVSLANESEGASSLVILAESELPGATSCENSAVFGLALENTAEPTPRIWSSESRLHDGSTPKGVLCRLVFEIPGGVTPQRQPTVRLTDGNLEDIRFRVQVGANAWPSWSQFSREQIQSSDFDLPLLKVTGTGDKPVLTRTGGDL